METQFVCMFIYAMYIKSKKCSVTDVKFVIMCIANILCYCIVVSFAVKLLLAIPINIFMHYITLMCRS